MTTKPRRINIAEPSTGKEEWLALRDSIESGWLTQGPKVAEFEAAFAVRHSTRHALATSSCTTALHLSLVALGVGPGDEVMVPAFTWIATANAVVYTGATPVFVDVDPVTYNLDPTALAKKLSQKTRAVIPVHLFGLCADMDAITSVLPDYVAVIEDAACAVGAEYKGRSAGALGDVGCFSFHPRKSITTGEGGMVTTDRSDIAEKVMRLRNHGASVPEEVRHRGPRPHILPDFDVLGFNYRMTDLQATMGLVQLAKLNRLISERRRLAAMYTAELESLGWLSLPTEPEEGRHGWQAFVCSVGEDAPLSRDALMDELDARGISTRPGTHAVHVQGYYRERFGLRETDYPRAFDCHQNTLALPLHNRMSDEDFDYVVAAITTIKNAR